MGVGIRNVDCLVKLAVNIPEVQDVDSFRRLVISSMGLSPNWVASKGNFVALDHFSVRQELQGPFVLKHEDSVGVPTNIGSRRVRTGGNTQQNRHA